MAQNKFKKGDTVGREVDIYDKSKGYRLGRVIDVYSKPQKKVGDVILGPYPELYSVEWDCGDTEHGFLPHGLDAIKASDT